MATKPKLEGWGDLNKALNTLAKAGVFLTYSTGMDAKAAEPTVDLTVHGGADQAEVVRKVRAVLPRAFSGIQVRTRTA